MNRATAPVFSLAKRIAAYAARESRSSANGSPTPFPLTETLRPQLATLLGRAGFRSLLARGLALAGREAEWLRTWHVNPDGSLQGGSEVTAKQVAAADVLLLAELLGLLVAFIGEGLTLQIVREAWPKLPLDDSDISQRNGQ